MKAAVPMNNEMKALLNQVIKNVSIPLFMENDQLEQAMGEMEAQQEQEAMQQQEEMQQQNIQEPITQ